MSAMMNELEKVRLERSCGIYMDEFEKGVTAIRLPCLHIFHGTCIFRWLEKNHKCPLCRHPLPHDDAGRFSFKPDDKPTMISQVLRNMSVPRHDQPPIVAKIFETVADGGGAFINVNIYHEALKLFDYRAFDRWHFRIRRIGIDRPITDEIDARVARELAEEESYGKARPNPATKSAIEGLERVRVDTSCGICMDDFEDGLLATRFPCLHIFHGDCILRWLETHYKCPLCRYPCFVTETCSNILITLAFW
ncbi:hypothetical protein ACLB2K_035991 [Fragaria x ananassa]